MVEAGAKEVTEEEMVQGLEAGHAAIKRIVDTIDALAKEAGKPKREVPEEGSTTRAFYREVEEKVIDSARRRDAHARQARELRHGRSGAGASSSRIDSRRRSAAQGRSEGDLQRAQGKGAARRSAREGRASRRPQVRRDPADLVRSRRAAPRSRLGCVYARRDAGARHRDARHVGRPAEDRNGRGRGLPPVHAALQLPAVLGGRSAVPARTRPARSRPRRACRARAAAGAAA